MSDDAAGAAVGSGGEDRGGRGALGRSAALMASGTAVSRVLGVVRAAVLAGAVGLNGLTADAFALANWLPTMLYMLVAGGVLNAVLVPAVVRAYRDDQGQEYVDRLLSFTLVVLGGVTLVVTAAAPLVVRVAGGGGRPDVTALATAFALWCLPQLFFYGLYTLLGQVLNARGSFGPYMWAPVVNNVVSIVGFGVFIALFGRHSARGPLADPGSWQPHQVALLAGVATLGIVLQALVLVVPLRRIGFRFTFRRDWRGAGLGTAGRVAGWTFAALAVGQVGTIVVTRVANTAGLLGHAEGVAGNNAYNNAFAVFMLPHSLVTVSLLTALFTQLSVHAAASDVDRVRGQVSYGLRTIAVFTVLATAVISVLALPLVRVVQPTVSPQESASLAPIVVALTVGLTALGVWSLAQRVFYAYEDAKGLFWIQVAMAGVVVTLTLVGALVLPVAWWVVGAGGAIAASYLLGAVWGTVEVRRRLGGSGRRALGVLLRSGAAGLAAVAVGWPLTRAFGDASRFGLLHAAGVCVVVGTVMLAVYLGGLTLLGVDEHVRLVGPLVARVRRTMGGPARGGTSGPGRPADGGDRLDVVVGRGTMLAGRYRLDQPVPTDLPDAEVWKAQDQILDRPVRAVVLRGARHAEAQDAARRAALVTDPRLLRVLDVGDHDGLPYVVTGPVVGRDLASLTVHGPLPADQARSIVGEAAVALEVARRRGVHHLALRPSAVHVTPDGGVLVSGLALDGVLLGARIGDARSTTRADTVALVALLYLTLTGRWPASGTSSASGPVPAGAGVRTAPVVEGTPVPPAEIAPGVPNDLDTLCAVTLGPHDDGPHSPAELVRELEPWGPIAAEELFGALDARAAWSPVRSVEESPARSGADATAAAAAAAGAAREHETTGTGEIPVVPAADAGDTSAPAQQSGAVEAATLQAAGDEADGAVDGAVDGGESKDAPGRDEPAPRTVQRQSVREATAGSPVPAARPGTPPPAIPPSIKRPDPRLTGAPASSPLEVGEGHPAAGGPAAVGGAAGPGAAPAGGAPAGGAPVAPGSGESAGAAASSAAVVSAAGRPARPVVSAPVVERRSTAPLTGGLPGTPAAPAAPAGPGGRGPQGAGGAPPVIPPGGLGSEDERHHDFDTIIGRSTQALTRRRFDPTPVVLALVGIAVVVGIVVAWQALTAPPPPIGGVGAIEDPTATAPADPTDPGAEAPAGDAAAPPAAAAPAIASAQMVDPPPGGDGNEHPEAVPLAIDGDPATAWYTRTYNSPTYGMKDGVGYAVTLAQPATVTTVTLVVNGSGGNVQVRLTDPSTPTEGPVLAEGPLGPETVLTLSAPTQGQHVVLWFTALPQTADGSNRVELAEVRVS